MGSSVLGAIPSAGRLGAGKKMFQVSRCHAFKLHVAVDCILTGQGITLPKILTVAYLKCRIKRQSNVE
jgi:hypothetical protein